MKKEPKDLDVKALTSVSLLVAIAVIFALVIFFIPFLQVIMFIISLPIIIIGVKFDVKLQIAGTIVLFLFLLILQPIYAVNVITTAGILGIVQGYLIKNNKKNSEVILFGTLVSFFGLIAYLYVLNGITGVNILEDTKIMLNDSFVELGNLYQNSNILPEEDMDSLMQMFNQTKDVLVMLIPTTLVLMSFVTSLLNFLVARAVLIKLNLNVSKTKFKDFRISKQGRLILFSVIFVVTVMSLIDMANQTIYIVNFTSILVLLFQINGFALIWYVSDYKTNTVALRVISVLLFIFAPLLGSFAESIVRYGILLFGIIDIFYDFRTKHLEKMKR